MTFTVETPLLGLENQFPDRVFVLHHPRSDRYGCYCHGAIHGLACFSDEAAAYKFADWIDLSGMVTREVTFDEAREVAKMRPLPVVSLMLLDSLSDPQIHYVR